MTWAGRPFFERGWASLAGLAAQHVHPDRARDRGGVPLQPGRDLRPLGLPGRLPRGRAGRSPSTSRRPASSRSWRCWARCWSCAPAERTGDALRALLNLAPKTARRLRDGRDDEEVPVAQVAAGDRLRVRPGDAVPVDGEVLDGASAVDEAMVTGESMPVAKGPGGKLIGGTGERRGRDGDAGREGRRRNHARADRRHGGRGAAQPRADPAGGGRRGRLVRAGRSWRSPPRRSRRGRSGGRRRRCPTRWWRRCRSSSSPAPARWGSRRRCSIGVGVAKGARHGRAHQVRPRRWSAWRRSTRWSSTRPAR